MDRTNEQGDAVLVAARINRLFATFHSRTEPEESNESIAAAVSVILGRDVSADQLADLRRENGAHDADPAVLAAISLHFGAPASYLDVWDPAAAAYDEQLSLLASLRDAGVKSLSMRGAVDGPDLLQVVEQLPPERR